MKCTQSRLKMGLRILSMEEIKMKDENGNRCAHPTCDCPVPQNESYCSPHCETAPKSEITCGCGHAACLTGKVAATTA